MWKPGVSPAPASTSRPTPTAGSAIPRGRPGLAAGLAPGRVAQHRSEPGRLQEHDLHAQLHRNGDKLMKRLTMPLVLLAAATVVGAAGFATPGWTYWTRQRHRHRLGRRRHPGGADRDHRDVRRWDRQWSPWRRTAPTATSGAPTGYWLQRFAGATPRPARPAGARPAPPFRRRRPRAVTPAFPPAPTPTR